MHTSFGAITSGDGSYLQFQSVPVIVKFAGPFPDFNEEGIYWSTNAKYPLVEGFFFNRKMLIGIQVTLSPPKFHSSAKVLGVGTTELLSKIADFCEIQKIGLALVLVVPSENFHNDNGGKDVLTQESIRNLLHMESFTECKPRSAT